VPALLVTGLIALALVSGAASPVERVRPAGATSDLSAAALAVSPAERIRTGSGGLPFPIDPLPRCIVGNNFGGDSKLYGANSHQGVDISATLGQEVLAVAAGTLSRQWLDTGAAGYAWELEASGTTSYRYFHLSGFAEGLEEGDRVVAGQLIGYVGDTGNPGAGNYHLHFEVREGDTPVDPVPLLDIPAACTILPKS
jgi:murein DD-endopeptidase MepM/ murein hydrolase activator NlpD